MGGVSLHVLHLNLPLLHVITCLCKFFLSLPFWRHFVAFKIKEERKKEEESVIST